MDHLDEWEKNGMVSREISKRAGELGLLCVNIPEEYGGGGLDFTFNALLIEAFAKKGITGPEFSLHSDIVAPYLLYYGTERGTKTKIFAVDGQRRNYYCNRNDGT